MSRAFDLLGQLGKPPQLRPATPPQDMGPDPFVRERGASNFNLLDEGRNQIHQVGSHFGQRLAESGRPRQVKIYSSPWARTKETSQILAQHLAPFKPTITEVPGLAPQRMGSLEGERSTDVQELVKRLKTQTPTNEPPGESPLTGQRGESQRDYEQRMLPAMEQIMKESARHPSLVSIVAAHSGDMRTIQAWAKAGFPKDYSVDRSGDTLTHSKGTAPTDRLTVGDDGKWKYEEGVNLQARGGLRPGVYLQRHGDTEFNTPRPDMLRSGAGRGEKTGTVESYRDNPTNPSVGGNSSGTPPMVNQY
jgi:broad specificity phosphatase PhoE